MTRFYQPNARMLEPRNHRRLERVEVAADRVRYLRDGVVPVDLRLREIAHSDICPNDKLFLERRHANLE